MHTHDEDSHYFGTTGFLRWAFLKNLSNSIPIIIMLYHFAKIKKNGNQFGMSKNNMLSKVVLSMQKLKAK